MISSQRMLVRSASQRAVSALRNTLTRRQPHVRLLGTKATTPTFYDSQSGLHVPLHNEEEVSVFLDMTDASVFEKDCTVYKVEALQSPRTVGYKGVEVPTVPNTKGAANKLLESIASSVPFNEDFTVFYPSSRMAKIPYPPNVNLMFEYNDSLKAMGQRLSAHVAQGTNTTIAVLDPCFYERDPILVASGIVSLIDSTGGGNYIWLAPDEETCDEEHVLRLCEELSYLDVEGATIKSRIVVNQSCCSDSIVEACLAMGVNKFVLGSNGSSGHEKRLRDFADVLVANGNKRLS